jgi:two-component system, LytTR family, sensor kinase
VTSDGCCTRAPAGSLGREPSRRLPGALIFSLATHAAVNYGFQAGDTVQNGTKSASQRYRPLLVNVAVWTLFGVLQSATWLLSPIGDWYPHPWSLVASGLFNAYLWAILTPFIFPLGARVIRMDRHRAAAVVGVLILGLSVSALVALAAAEAHDVLLRGPRGASPRPSALSLWALSRWYFEEVVLFFLILGAGVATEMWGRFRARENEAARLQAQAHVHEAERAELNARLADARLALLRSQLNPHFLFNTLNAVSALVAKDPVGVRDMIALLSELLRSALTAANEEEIPVEREIGLLRLYLEILEIRYQGQLRTRTVLDAETQDALVPRMILQPLVENAMKHGVDPGGGGLIDIRVTREGEDLVLSVQDTGTGMSKPVAADGAGVGLRLTRQRLAELYGPDQKLELLDAGGGGTIARIALPFHTSADLHVAAELE